VNIDKECKLDTRSSLKICPHCEENISQDSITCEYCGEVLPIINENIVKNSDANVKKCTFCFENIPLDSKFCNFCHEELVQPSLNSENRFEKTNESPFKSKYIIVFSISFIILFLLCCLGMKIYDSDINNNIFGNKSFFSKPQDKNTEINQDENYYINIADENEKDNQHESAIQNLKKALEINPESFQAYLKLGLIHSNMGHNELALKNYKKALEINPASAIVYKNMGVIYDRQGSYELAVKTYKKAISIDPDLSDVYYNLALTYSKTFDSDNAITYCQKAINLKPDYKKYSLLGSLYNSKGDYDNAALYYQKSVKAKPDYDIYSILAEIYKNKKAYPNAIEAYKGMIKLKPQEASNYIEVGDIYLSETKYDNAVTYYKKALNESPNDSSIQYKIEQANSTKMQSSSYQSNDSSSDDVNFGPYMRELQRRIKRNWHPPRGSQSKRVVVLFKVSKDGGLLELNIKESSGDSETDDVALEAIKMSTPFRSLPSEYKGKDIDIQFKFDYNVFSKSDSSGPGNPDGSSGYSKSYSSNSNNPPINNGNNYVQNREIKKSEDMILN